MGMKNFNLLVSTSRFNEINAKAELWFLLLINGDHYPIISNLKFLGLITAMTSIKARIIITAIKDLLGKDPDFFQYILKIVPIDLVCETNTKLISQMVKTNYRNYIKKQDTFKIELKRRKNELVERDRLIESAAKKVENSVDLDNPDKIIRIEVLGNFTGIAFIKPEDIIRVGKIRT
jgi:tRNA acetyltransferase TAN1